MDRKTEYLVNLGLRVVERRIAYRRERTIDRIVCRIWRQSTADACDIGKEMHGAVQDFNRSFDFTAEVNAEIERNTK